MKQKAPIFFLEDIKQSLDKIFRYTEGVEFEQFVSNDMLKDAVERNFEVIGEAVKNLPDDLRSSYPNVPFKQVAGMRDKLIHDYFGVDYSLVWNTIKEKLPQFRKDIEEIINGLKT